jgi:hypothetical protein
MSLGSFELPWKKLSLRYASPVAEYRFTDYFESEVLRKRPCLKKEWCIPCCGQADSFRATGEQSLSLLGRDSELGRFLRVVTLDDKVMIHNALPDRRFKP